MNALQSEYFVAYSLQKLFRKFERRDTFGNDGKYGETDRENNFKRG